jgi:hypothetical protein
METWDKLPLNLMDELAEKETSVPHKASPVSPT